jgi:hypothetical protein
MFQTGNGKDGRKAPEVIFSRESFYIWNVPIGEGDLAYLINENDKYFVEVTDLVGKEKRRWQTRMGTENIPKYLATLVYIGGGRPKAARLNDSIDSNTNLQQWLRKRGMNMKTFTDLTAGRLPPKNTRRDSDEDMYSYPVHPNRKENSPFSSGAGIRKTVPDVFNVNSMNNVNCSNHVTMSTLPSSMNHFSGVPSNINGHHQVMDRKSAFLTRAMNLTQRTMQLRTPEDPEVGHLLQDESDAELAIFLSKTLTNAILMFHGSQNPRMNPGNPPGPIGPPRSNQRRDDFNDFYSDNGGSLLSNGVFARGNIGTNGVGGGNGLYGLTTPLLDCQRNGLGTLSNDIEPPHKRRVNEW